MTAILAFEGAYRFLSNFYPGAEPIRLAMFSFPTAEHLYQALKTEDLDEAEAIAACATPGQAKRMGRTLTLRPDWDDVKDRAMAIAVSRKFLSDPELLRWLLATGDAELIEGNKWHDNYWGACYCPKCEDKTKHNMLGVTLMNLRDELNQWTKIDI